jgi:hypothetical protein
VTTLIGQSALDRLLGALDALGPVKRSGDSYSARCPAHDDNRPSLGVKGVEGHVLICCYAGCSADSVTAALGLSLSDLYDDPKGITYRYPGGRMVHRSPDKRFHQSGDTKDRTLYRADQVARAVAEGRTVYVVEGEKDVHALESVGAVATCSPMGAGKWRRCDQDVLRGANVIIVADQDDPGRRHVADVADALRGIAATITTVAPVVGKDAADHVAAGHSLGEFQKVTLPGDDRVTSGLPQLIPLPVFLAIEDDPVSYRISDLLPVGGRAVIAAQFKAGKTTTIGNLVRSLSDADDFLGRFAVTTARVTLIDNEMDARQLRRWLRAQGIQHPENVKVATLRGQVSSFDILDPAVRAQWADRLRGTDVLIFDCLRPVLDALGLDENRDAGKFLVAFDALLREAGISEAIVVHHMGHNGERSRGDSRLRDWPDVEWRLVRNGDEPDAPRFFSAYGRDVDVPELAVTFDSATRHLTAGQGNRKDAATTAALDDVLDVLTAATEPLSRNRIESALKDMHPQKTVRRAIDLGVSQGNVNESIGARGARLCIINPATSSPRRTSSPPRQRSHLDLVTSSIGDEVEVEVGTTSTSSTVPRCDCGNVAEQGNASCWRCAG